MTHMSIAMKWFAAALLVLAGAMGCVGHMGESTSEDGQYLLDLDPSGVIAASVWQEAPSGCEGRIDAAASWQLAWAEGDDSLGVVVDESGAAICVDTWEAIAEALSQAMGDPSPDPMLPRAGER